MLKTNKAICVIALSMIVLLISSCSNKGESQNTGKRNENEIVADKGTEDKHDSAMSTVEINQESTLETAEERPADELNGEQKDAFYYSNNGVEIIEDKESFKIYNHLDHTIWANVLGDSSGACGELTAIRNNGPYANSSAISPEEYYMLSKKNLGDKLYLIVYTNVDGEDYKYIPLCMEYITNKDPGWEYKGKMPDGVLLGQCEGVSAEVIATEYGDYLKLTSSMDHPVCVNVRTEASDPAPNLNYQDMYRFVFGTRICMPGTSIMYPIEDLSFNYLGKLAEDGFSVHIYDAEHYLELHDSDEAEPEEEAQFHIDFPTREEIMEEMPTMYNALAEEYLTMRDTEEFFQGGLEEHESELFELYYIASSDDFVTEVMNDYYTFYYGYGLIINLYELQDGSRHLSISSVGRKYTIQDDICLNEQGDELAEFRNAHVVFYTLHRNGTTELHYEY